MLSGIKLHDFNCGLKAYKKQVVKSIEVYGEMHRYIPIIAKQAGFGKIGEKVVQHRKREFGVSKFGVNRFVNGYLDLMSIMFVSKFGKKPMHFFGLLGSIMFFVGIVSAAVLGIQKLIAVSSGEMMRLITDSRPMHHDIGNTALFDGLCCRVDWQKLTNKELIPYRTRIKLHFDK